VDLVSEVVVVVSGGRLQPATKLVPASSAAIVNIRSGKRWFVKVMASLQS
jgi:hypothetical protein